jgi:branched-chain amino acid transport system permease protein
VVLLVGAAGVLAAPPYYVHLAILVLISAILAMSLNLLMGYVGLTSFGHAAYFGVGAYTAAALLVRYGVDFWTAAPAGVLAAALLGALFGVLATPARGVYFLLITMALGQIVWGLAFRWVSMTGGDNGLPGIPRPPLTVFWPLSDVRGAYLFVLLVAAATFGLLALILASPVGYVLRGIRESERRMRTLGYPVWWYTYAAFVLSATLAGIAGVLFATYNGFISPADLHLAVSAQAVLMVIIGGTGTLAGPVVGAAVLVLLQNLLSTLTRRWMTMLGLLFILAVLYSPEGLVGLLRVRRPTWRTLQTWTAPKW